MKKKIYLAGRITGLSYKDATAWRERIKRGLGDKYIYLDPMRDKELLVGCKEIGVGLKSSGVRNSEIFSRDLEDIREADIILVNLTDGYTFGTAWEMGYVYGLVEYTNREKELIVVCDNNNREHPFVEGSLEQGRRETEKSRMFSDVGDVIRYLSSRIEKKDLED